jgi:Ca2+-binding RTX toxin-like protein
MNRTRAATTVLLTAALAGPALGVVRAEAAPAPLCAGLPATIVGTHHDDKLVGTPGNDVIVGSGGDDLILGRGGKDVICGGAGSDRLLGGPGSDQLYGGLDKVWRYRGVGTAYLGDELVGGLGNDVLQGGADARDAAVYPVNGDLPDLLDYSGVHPHHGHGVTVRIDLGTAHGAGTDAILPGRYAVYGTTGADTVVGGPLDDVIRTYGGDDVVYGGDGNDQIWPDQGSDTDTPDHDVVHAGAGNDVVESHDGGDGIYGAEGDDRLVDWGQNGVDKFIGGVGNDLIEQVVSARRGERADGGEGVDTIFNMDGAFPKGRMTCTGFEDVSRSGPYC